LIKSRGKLGGWQLIFLNKISPRDPWGFMIQLENICFIRLSGQDAGGFGWFLGYQGSGSLAINVNA